MTRFKILGRGLTKAEIEAVKTLVDDAGCISNNQIDIVTSVGDADPDAEDEVILVLATPATCADADLENNLAQAQKGGRRVIWIWPEQAEVAELPAPAAKYSYSAIPWNAEKLRAVAADDDVMCFETPAGAPLPKVPTERNLCVEEKAKTK